MKQSKISFLTHLGLFAALVLVMAYTPLGYLRLFALEITFMMIPVTVGAILMGPMAGAILGGLFGLTSFGTCFGTSAFGAALLAINPVYTFLVCVVARVLAGWLAGVAFRVVHILPKMQSVAFGVAALLGPVLNTTFFMGALVLLFYQTDYIQDFVAALGVSSPLTFVLAFVGLQGVVEAAVGFFLSGVVSRALYRATHKTVVQPIVEEKPE